MSITSAIRSAALAALSLWCCVLPSLGEELVTFNSTPSRRYQTPFSRAQGEIVPVIPAAQIQGYLSKPAGDGPFPAVVLLHSCNGLSPTRRAVAETIVSWGYVALFVDDFTTRGIRQMCAPVPGQPILSEAMQDALGGLLYVAKLPFVDVRRLAVVGFSQGGNTALSIAMDRLPPLVDDLKPPVPRAVVSFYPWCSDTRGRLTVPLLILIGERDDWTPASDCDELWRKRGSEGPEFKLAIYPGAYHAFDNPGPNRELFGHHLQYDADAASRAMAEMRAFLAKYLSAN